MLVISFCCGSPQIIQRAFDRVAFEVSRYGIYFAPSKCKVLLQVWQQPIPALALCDGRLEVVSIFKYLGSLVTPDRGVGEEVTLRIAKIRLDFPNAQHLWRHHDIRSSLKEMVCNATVRSFLLYGCEASLIRV